jgi:hypothetical protein
MRPESKCKNSAHAKEIKQRKGTQKKETSSKTQQSGG